MKLYVYCLTAGIDALPHALRGIDGAEVRLLKARDFTAVVSSFAGERVAVNRENVLAHSAVAQNLLAQTTPLPFRFGVLATEEQLESFLTARHDALKERLNLVGGCVEMSVKVISRATDGSDGHHDQVSGRPEDKPGTAFLLEKRRELLGSEARTAEARELVSWLESQTGNLVRQTQINTNITDKLLISAAHLVDRGVMEQYRARLKQVRNERPDLNILVSGPWPPYSFANINLEVATQFGVS
ncbi:MAG TPA: GvpL/GvpF family gas vesicle protein [Pyrinomonadaceae bacterium]|nr:GvpL/GvpF family gas vesicle protein [Pyrinomonadaceae bacterium]